MQRDSSRGVGEGGEGTWKGVDSSSDERPGLCTGDTTASQRARDTHTLTGFRHRKLDPYVQKTGTRGVHRSQSMGS